MIKSGKKSFTRIHGFSHRWNPNRQQCRRGSLVFVLGSHQVFPALEEALLGLKIGDTKQVVLNPEEAYGPVVPDAYREVDIDTVPAPYRYTGAVLGVQDPAGGVYPIRVHEIKKEEKVVLDFNHPLAGHALGFDVKVMDVD